MDDLQNMGYDYEEDDYINECIKSYENETIEIEKLHPNGFCESFHDIIICWPPTPINQTAVVRCYSDFIEFDQSQNATKYCLPDGNWSKSDYTNCVTGVNPEVQIYFIGYFISLVTLLIAMGIFTFFKELQCLRNTIHKNLMWSYIFTYTTWIFILVMIQHFNKLTVICNLILTFYQYFHNTTFFWMFVEGLYLYILVVETMTRRNFTYREFALVGWGVPLLFILIWAITRSIMSESMMCSWFDDNPVDWINNGAQLIVLVVNLFFLLSIMWVLITKLRTANTAEIRQSYKAAKALLVLIPLLGITYVITIYAPTPVFKYTRAVLLSTQGFAVALLYCFMNAEVQRTIKHHFENWKANRSLGSNRTSSGSHWWPRSRTHSMRHTEWTLVNTEEIQAAINQSTVPNGNGVARVESDTV